MPKYVRINDFIELHAMNSGKIQGSVDGDHVGMSYSHVHLLAFSYAECEEGKVDQILYCKFKFTALSRDNMTIV